ncbi:phage minor head protein [Acidihalobacter prosperus]|uniref:Phage head morphogenesis domain-containing protein n=1 Tax=Acidihalobacter prosperus TaxID=160660 RepID=A0A1A6C8B8_9GAMM|nr:phage minor head protein [Acidihalobacter prosperus]OBS10795.1 hypothetical protein Thpro_020511 [Acidihalobacter prosperus]
MTDPQPSAIGGILGQPFPQQLAFFRQKLANLVPTAAWDDMLKSAHDRGFMVAGAAKADLLSDLAAAVERAIGEGQSLEAFRKDFRAIVERNGWHGWTGEGSAAGEAWRTRIIYKTNAATSYAAGRFAQLKAFPLWVYRHTHGERYPRPQHEAWDGLTLRQEDAFWNAHYPPNGWGCRCYVVGARSERGAERLGGDSSKPLPDGWDRTDAKTGEPPGIDKGWGYAPGASVSDTVEAMAAKTTQWPYTIAKAYMQSMPADVRDSLARSYRSLPSVADDTRRYAQAVVEDRSTAPYRTLGLVTSKDAHEIQTLTGKNVSGFDFALDPSAIRHVQDKHGNPENEAARGQRPVTTDDYAQLPALLNAQGILTDAGFSRTTKLPLVKWQADIDGEQWSAVFEIRKGRRMLALQTLHIRNERQP